MPSETNALLRSIRQWLLVIVFLLGIGTLTLAHTGYALTITRVTYLQTIVCGMAGVSGGVAALVAGFKILRKDPPTVDNDCIDE